MINLVYKNVSLIKCIHYYKNVTKSDTNLIKMINATTDMLLDCDECDMKKLDDSDLFPGLFTKLVLLTIVSFLTTVANVFLMYIAGRTRSIVNNTKVFFNSLCIAHMLGSIIVVPLWIVTRLSPEMAATCTWFCQIASFVMVLMILASFYSLSALSLDRYFIISDPMRYPFKSTTNKKILVVILLWMFCVLFASAPMIGWGQYKFQPDAIPICGLNMKYSQSFTIVLIALGFALPIVIDIYCCGKIIAIARRQARSIDSRKGSNSSTTSTSSTRSAASTKSIQPIAKLSKLKQKINSLRLVFAGTGSFLFCWLPYIVAHVWMTTVRNISHNKESMPYILEFVVLCVALMNGLINPVVIMVSNRDYRREIKSVLYRRFGIYSPDDRSDAEYTPTTQRRLEAKSSDLTRTFRTIPEFHLEVASPKNVVLKKQDSTGTLDCSFDISPSTPSTPSKELLDVRKLTAVTSFSESRKLITQSSSSSADPDSPLEHVFDGMVFQSVPIRYLDHGHRIETKAEIEHRSGTIIK